MRVSDKFCEVATGEPKELAYLEQGSNKESLGSIKKGDERNATLEAMEEASD